MPHKYSGICEKADREGLCRSRSMQRSPLTNDLLDLVFGNVLVAICL